MPKKTKREKIIARYRRKVKTLQNQKIETTLNQEPPKTIFIKKAEQLPEKKKDVKIVMKSAKEDQVTLYYFIKDLKKSLFYIVLIIVLEVLLYFVKI